MDRDAVLDSRTEKHPNHETQRDLEAGGKDLVG